MTALKIYVESLDLFLVVGYPKVDYSFRLNRGNVDESKYAEVINKHIEKIDCTQTLNGSQVINTVNYNYETELSIIYWYILKLKNQFEYNAFLDRLTEVHKNNIVFERKLIIIQQESAKYHTAVKEKGKLKIKNEYVKQVSTDMFTNRTIYIYSNSFTDDVIKSEDPNLLEALNATKKKRIKKDVKEAKPATVKRIKKDVQQFKGMKFTFKKS